MRAAKKYALVALISIAGLAMVLLNYKQRDSYRCQTCWARRDVFQWKIGSWIGSSIPLTPKWERIADTNFLHDIFPADHVPDWKYAEGSPYYWFGTQWSGCAIGPGRHVSRICDSYERWSDFRTFIQNKLRDGSITKAKLIALASQPGTGEPSALVDESDALLKSYYSR